MTALMAWFKLPITYVVALVAVAGIGVVAVTTSQPAQATPGICAVADTVVLTVPGDDINPDTNNDDPQNALEYDGLFYSLGHGGMITVAFTSTSVLDGPGADILIAESNAPEGAEILVSADGVNFVSLGTHNVAVEGYFDIAGTGLPMINFVKITDDNVDPELGIPSLEAGFDVDSVEAYYCGEPEPTPTPTPEPSPTPEPTPTPPPPTATPTPPTGGEGCTPGYWRQPHHLDSWVGFDPSDLVDDVFGVTSSDNPTLFNATWLKGGGENALLRHAVAAILNASSPDVDYSMTVAEIIAAVQDAYATGDFEPLKDILDEENNEGCDLD